MNLDALVTATEASTKLHDVSRPLIGMWVRLGKLKPRGKRGRSPLYRWGTSSLSKRRCAPPPVGGPAKPNR